MKKTILIILAWFISLVLVEVFIQCHNHISDDGYTITDTITIYKEYSNPQAKDSIQTKVITCRLPIAYAVHDTITSRDTIIDSVAVSVPISKKIFYGTDYYAEISGYQQSLDSIRIRQSEVVNTTIQESSKFGIGVSGGYAITPKGFQPYIGIGIQYNIFTFNGRKRTIKSSYQ